MGVFDFLRKSKKDVSEHAPAETSPIKRVIASTNNMIKMQLLIASPPSLTGKELFQDIFFLGYFYGIHDAAFQFSGQRRSPTEMHITYMLAVADFFGANTPSASKEIADDLIEILSKITSSELLPEFQRAQIIAGTEYYALVEGKTSSLVGLTNHLCP